MERVDVKVSFSCNNRCRFCVQGDKRERFKDRSTAEAKKLLREARRRADAIVFTGGEPSVRPDFLELVAEARKLGYRLIQLQTNGQMLAYRAFARGCREAGVTEVSPALHGHVPALHDFLTGRPGSFGFTLRGIENARAEGLPVVTNTVVTKPNRRHLAAIARLLADRGVSQMQFAFVHPVGTAALNFASIVPRMELMRDELFRAFDVAGAAGIRSMSEAVPLCILRGREAYAAEWIIPDAAVFDAEGTIDDYRAFRLGEGKAKGPPCRRCLLDPVCEGPWREYPERFGWSEFHARRDASAREVLARAGRTSRRGA
ncbi:MAG: radical SAM protein [Deltaproteobacteria bacterium]|nr:radical SAM protein [Deltaproteobacteria bacterium]